MSRPPGLSKTGGRIKGTPNRKTMLLQSVTDDLGLDVPRRLGELLPLLDPDKQADVLLELMGYIYPKRRAIEHSGPEGGPIEVHSNRERIRQILADPEANDAIEVLERKLSNQNGIFPS